MNILLGWFLWPHLKFVSNIHIAILLYSIDLLTKKKILTIF